MFYIRFGIKIYTYIHILDRNENTILKEIHFQTQIWIQVQI